MDSQNMDSLENFFRNRAQIHNPEFKEGDWQKLEALLDKEWPVTFPFWSFLKKFWYVSLFLIVLPISWFTISLVNSGSQNISNNYITSTQITKSDDRKLTKKENIETNQDLNATQINEKTKIVESTLSKKETIFPSSSFVNNNEQITSKIPSEPKPIIPANIEFENIEEKNYAVFENGVEIKGHILIYELHFLSPIHPEFNNYDGIMPEFPDLKSPVELVTKSKSKPSFYVGIGYSPDFSTVGIGNFVAPGSRWKAIVEIGISNRFLLNTGIVFVNNQYEAYGEDYHAPSRYWRKGTVAEKAYGECKMIDIPLNLRYNLFNRNNHQLFISGGASTYFLLKEDYYFDYEQDDPDLPDHWGTDEMTVYPFGIVNISIGYQYQFGRKGALQIEPFIKIPTTGIGWGNVNLHTIGAYFIYKYQIGK